MAETLRGLEAGTMQPRPQDHSRASLAPILKREDGLIDFRRTASDIINRLRGFQPWPGAFTSFRGKQLQVPAARVAQASLAPGEVKAEGDRLLVGCGENTALELVEVQPEGKKRMSARDFINGYRPKAGERLGESVSGMSS